jgi:uncharacterized membrane protein YagU involved in acid resistance
MKQTVIDYLKKAFAIHNVISRLFQFGISIVVSMIVYVLAYNYGQSELAQGFYSGVCFYFMLDQLNGVFRK